MLKTFAVALFAIVMSVGLAHATHAHKPMMAACAEGQRATARCLLIQACLSAASRRRGQEANVFQR